MTTSITPDQVRGALVAARTMIDTPAKRTREVGALDERDHEVDPQSPDAVRWSAYGALEATRASRAVVAAATRLLDAATRERHKMGFVEASDTLDHADLMAAFDAAIATTKTPAQGDQLPLGGGTKTAAGDTKAAAGGTTAAASEAKVPDQVTSPSAAATNVPALPPNVGKGLIRDIDSLLAAFAEFDKLRDRFNLCVPLKKIDFIPPGYAMSFRPVALDTRLDQKGHPLSKDIYYDQEARGYALSKIGLDKFGRAAGISFDTARMDDERDPLYARYKARGIYTALDGQVLSQEKEKSCDLRDGSPEAAKMTAAQLSRARIHVPQYAETKAQNRVVRAIGFIQSAYSKEEIGKVFVTLALVFTGETDDPVQKAAFATAIAGRATGATRALFGPLAAPTRRLPPPPVGDDPDAESGEGGGEDEHAPY